MKKMRFKKTVLAVAMAMAMSGMCGATVAQAQTSDSILSKDFKDNMDFIAPHYVKKVLEESMEDIEKISEKTIKSLKEEVDSFRKTSGNILKNMDNEIAKKTADISKLTNKKRKGKPTTKSAKNSIDSAKKELLLLKEKANYFRTNRKEELKEIDDLVSQETKKLSDLVEKLKGTVGKALNVVNAAGHAGTAISLIELKQAVDKVSQEADSFSEISLEAGLNIAKKVLELHPVGGIVIYGGETLLEIEKEILNVGEVYREAITANTNSYFEQYSILEKMATDLADDKEIERQLAIFAATRSTVRKVLEGYKKDIEAGVKLGLPGFNVKVPFTETSIRFPSIETPIEIPSHAGQEYTLQIINDMLGVLGEANEPAIRERQKNYVMAIKARNQAHSAIKATAEKNKEKFNQILASMGNIFNQILANMRNILDFDNLDNWDPQESPDPPTELAESDADQASKQARKNKRVDITQAFEALQARGIGGTKWQGGVSAVMTYCDLDSGCATSTRHDSGSANSVQAKMQNGGKRIDFYTDFITFDMAPDRYRTQVKINFDNATSRQHDGRTYYYGEFTPSTQTLFGLKADGGHFEANDAMDFFLFSLYSLSTFHNASRGNMFAYYGHRLDKSKVPNQGVSSYAHGNGHIVVNWATNKVYGHGLVGAQDFFVGSVNRQTREITGRFIQKDDYLYPADYEYYPGRKRFVSATPSLQLYGRDQPNGIGGTFDFGPIYSFGGPSECVSDPASGKCADPTLPIATGNVLLAAFLDQENIKEKHAPKNDAVWEGFAAGVTTQHYDTGINDYDPALIYSTNLGDVSLTLRPKSGEMKGTLAARKNGSGTQYGVASNWQDGVYVNKHAFGAVRIDGDALSYIATTANNEDGYDYMAWGVWGEQLNVASDNSLTKIHDAYWIAGAPTIDMPKTGTATYHGTVKGAAFSHDGYQIPIAGTSEVVANFGTKRISGHLDIQDTGLGGGGTYANAAISASMKDNHFTGKLSGPDITTGTIRGAFYGAGAAEVGGNWNITKSDSQATGIFAGKKQ